MDLLYLDIWPDSCLFEDMGRALMELYLSEEQKYADEVMAALDTIASKRQRRCNNCTVDYYERMCMLCRYQ